MLSILASALSPDLNSLRRPVSRLKTGRRHGRLIEIELNEKHVAKSFAELANRTGPGAANRRREIPRNMLNKPEVWGYSLEKTNPARRSGRCGPSSTDAAEHPMR